MPSFTSALLGAGLASVVLGHGFMVTPTPRNVCLIRLSIDHVRQYTDSMKSQDLRWGKLAGHRFSA